MIAPDEGVDRKIVDRLRRGGFQVDYIAEIDLVGERRVLLALGVVLVAGNTAW